MMTKEIDKDNLILFPTDRIVKRNPNQGLSEKLQKNLELAKTKEYVEQAVDQIALDLLRKFVDMGINTKTPNFTKDLAMLVDTLRGLVYRDFGVKHPAQQMTDRMVQVKTTTSSQVIHDTKANKSSLPWHHGLLVLKKCAEILSPSEA